MVILGVMVICSIKMYYFWRDGYLQYKKIGNFRLISNDLVIIMGRIRLKEKKRRNAFLFEHH